MADSNNGKMCFGGAAQELAPGEVMEPAAFIQPHHEKGEVGAAKPYVCGVRMSPKLICTIMFIYAIACGPCYVNFNPLRDVFIRDNAYAWKCDNFDPSNPPKPVEGETPKALCESQELSISFLFTVASASHFISACSGGILLDTIGPKMTGLVGIALQILAWLMIALSTQNFQAYIPGFMFIGMGMDAAFFGAFAILALFPGHENGILGIFGATRSLSFAIPLLIKGVAYGVDTGGMRKGVSCTILIFLIVCFFVAMFIFPMSTWRPTRRNLNLKKKISSFRKSSKTVDNDEAVTPSITSPSITPSNETTDMEKKAEEPSCLTLTPLDPEDDVSVYAVLLSKYFLPLVLYMVIYVTVTVFYTPSADIILPDVYELHQYLQIFSFIPAPFLGYLADRTDIIYVMYLLNLNLLVIYFFAMMPGIPAATPCQLFSSICFSVALSFKMSQVYCFASSHLPPQHIGKLVGTLTMIAGIFTFGNAPLQAFARNNNQYLLTMILMFFVIASMYFPLGFLHKVTAAKKIRKKERAALRDAVVV